MRTNQVLEKLDRITQMAQRFEGFIDKIPRLAEMLGVAYLAGKASEKLGGDFFTGSVGGVVADGLAHSRLPNNQIGGLALGTYFAALGVTTIAPVGDGGTTYDPLGIVPEDYPAPRLTTALTREECAEQGGVWIAGILGGGCRLPDW